jgi:hypothetical protein
MGLKRFCLIAVSFISIISLIFAYFLGIRAVVDALFIVGAIIFTIGAFIASGIGQMRITRAILYAYPRIHETWLEDRRRAMRTGLYLMALGSIMMLISIIMWEASPSFYYFLSS